MRTAHCRALDDSLLDFHDFWVLYATHSAPGICQWMSRQRLHQPCVVRKFYTPSLSVQLLSIQLLSIHLPNISLNRRKLPIEC